MDKTEEMNVLDLHDLFSISEIIVEKISDDTYNSTIEDIMNEYDETLEKLSK
ncbi:hypothetical protein [Fusobacterium sp. PH5-44]|uniref:hypothetical protein n=1 Tax=unclassified Fusobacterium TaxID=2648384 RepID=UPI003D22E160